MLARKIAYNTLISAGARIIGLALSLVTLGFLTRYLGSSGFGQYSTVLAFLYIFVVLADFGLYSICVREISRPQADEKKIVSNAFTIRLVLGLSFFVLAPLVGLLFPYNLDIKMGILIGAFGFWMMSNHQVLMGVFQKYLKMGRAALAELAGRLVHLGLVVFFVQQQLGFLYLIGALVGGAVVNFVLVFLLTQKYVTIRLDFDFVFWKKLLKESLPLGMASILTMIYFKLDTVMLSLFKPQADVGIYSLAYRILESLIFFSAMFVGLIMPLMSRYAVLDKAKFKKITQKTLDILLIFVVPLVIVTFFLSDKIIVLISGQQFILSAGVLNILIIATGVIYLAVLFSNMIISIKQQKILVYLYGLGALINVVANLIFIPKYSYYGAAATTLFTEIVVTALMFWVLAKYLKYSLSFRSVLRPMGAALVMALALYIFSSWSLFGLMLLATIVYFSVLYLIGGFSAKDVLALIQREN